MNKILLFFIICNTTFGQSIFSSPDYQSKNAVGKFRLSQDRMLVDVSFGDRTVPFTFDTGAGIDVIRDSLVYTSKNYKIFEAGKVKLQDGLAKRKNLLADYTSDLYQASKAVLAILPNKNKDCQAVPSQGVMGHGYFSENEKILSLNFDLSEMRILERPDASGYQKIKSDFFLMGSHVKIFLNVNGVEEPFHFDTGNSAFGLILAKNSKIQLTAAKQYKGSVLSSANGLRDFSALNNISSEMTVNLLGTSWKMEAYQGDFYTAKYNNAGLKFIKNFNWIIDYKNKQVFVQKRSSIEKIDDKKLNTYLVNIEGNTLILSAKTTATTQYALGQQILSVNGTPITSENICQYQKLLNETENWDTLKLVVR